MSDQNSIGDGLDALSAAEGLEDDSEITGAPPDIGDYYDYELEYEPEPAAAPHPAAVDAIAAIGSEVVDMRRAQEADELTEVYPELAEPENARQLIADVVERAEALGHPELAGNVNFWRQVHEANAGAASRQQHSTALTAESIVTGGRSSGKGAGALPFGP
jgi:nucleotide-binding universal stress UspA family protein